MLTQILTCFSFFFIQKSYGKQQNNLICIPSSCGSIQNISYPFRLKDIDPPHCGDSDYELLCVENNNPSIYLNSQEFHVLAINYDNFTIRLADATVLKNDSCSFPRYSLSPYNFTYRYYNYSPYAYGLKGYKKPAAFALPDPHTFRSVTLMSCPYTVEINDSLFHEETINCTLNVGNNSTSARRTYLTVGGLNASNVRDTCKIELTALTSWYNFKDDELIDKVSVLEIHDSLLYGFELSWFIVHCGKCKRRYFCHLSVDNSVTCSQGGHRGWFFIALDDITYILRYCIVIIIAIRILIGMPCVFGFLIYKYRRRHLSMFDVIEGFLKSQNNLMPIRYSYSHIKKMTRNFREKLGSGGYGSVYKGKLRSGRDVAVKVLNDPQSNGQDFINEVATIGRIHHVNVVRLVGYCAERSKRALVYDFMPNGSLEKYIFVNQEERIDDSILNWEKKYEIALGVARGIEYLHRGCDIQILHFDIKPHNILLDEIFIPKISDFGLAKFYSTDNSIVTLTAARGTIGYVAPELINRSIGGVSYKADVYSFGMLLMEMLGLKKNLAADNDNSSMYFPYWIYDRFNKGKDLEFGNVDDNQTRRITRKITKVALWCVQMNPDDRPPMSKVVEMLEKDEQFLQVPPQPSSQTPQEMFQMIQDQTWGTTIDDDSNDSIALMHEHASNDQ